MGKPIGMKRVDIAKPPLTLLGRPFRIMDLEAQPAAEIYKCQQCGADVEVQKPVMMETALLPDLLKTLILSIPRQAVTMQDSINAGDFMQQLAESEDGVMKVTDGIHDWLKRTVEKHGPMVFGVNVIALKTALDNFARAVEKKAS